jgi:lipoprotein signal peptidase
MNNLIVSRLRADAEIRLRPLPARGSLFGIRSDRVAHSRLHAVQYFLIALQLIVALGILNVWMLRSGKATPFRGGDAKNLREEFAAYGLPFWFMCVVGVLKVGLAVALIAAIWVHRVAQPAAIGLGVLMLGALVMHLKVKDPIKKALPSIAVLAMCAAIALL